MNKSEYNEYIREHLVLIGLKGKYSAEDMDNMRFLSESFYSFGIPFFYKYMKIDEYTWINLDKKQIHLTEVEKLNDVFEGKSFIDYKSNFDSEVGTTILNDTMKTVADYVNSELEAIRKRTSVFSVTTSWNNMPMWGTYGDSFRGVCFEYDAMAFYNMFEIGLAPIDYSEEIPKTSIKELITGQKGIFDKTFFERLERNNIVRESKFKEEEIRFIHKIFTTKYTPWKKEDEWRVIDIDLDAKVDDENGLNGVCGRNLTGDNRLLPTSILLGPQIVADNKDRFLKFAQNLNVDLYQVEVKEDGFGLKKRLIYKKNEDSFYC